ncbi:hypothetical protein B4900_04335 [Yersinia rohdei]|nr:hypothetical protein B4900_04335 [Yersinia rohdei]
MLLNKLKGSLCHEQYYCLIIARYWHVTADAGRHLLADKYKCMRINSRVIVDLAGWLLLLVFKLFVLIWKMKLYH